MRLHCRILPKFPKSLFLHLSQWHHTEKVFPISKNSVFCILADSLIIYLFFWLLSCSYQCPNIWYNLQHVQVKMSLSTISKREGPLTNVQFLLQPIWVQVIFNGPFLFFINKLVNLWQAAFDMTDVALHTVFCFHARLCNLYLHGHCGKKLVVWMIFYWWWDTSWCRFMHFCT